MNKDNAKDYLPLVTGNSGDGLVEAAADRVVRGAVIYADALMKELELDKD